MLRIFIGYDPRQPISYQVLHYSIMRTASEPVAITPLCLGQLPIKRQGLTPFTYSRFLVPWLCKYEGVALFLDADMLLLDDIANLFALAEPNKAVQAVLHDKHFERASLMLFNCGLCRVLTPEYVDKADGLHIMSWIPSRMLGALPHEWNHLVGYDDPRDDAKLVHYTQGVPLFPETRGCEYSDAWLNTANLMNSALPWEKLMGDSVHAVQLADGRKVPRLQIGEARILEILNEQARHATTTALGG